MHGVSYRIQAEIQTEDRKEMTEFSYCVYPRLQSALLRKKQTRKALAKAVGISYSNVWWWLSGNNARTIETIQALLRERADL